MRFKLGPNIGFLILFPLVIPNVQLSYILQAVVTIIIVSCTHKNKLGRNSWILLYFPWFFLLQMATLANSDNYTIRSILELTKPLVFFLSYYSAYLIDWGRTNILRSLVAPIICISILSGAFGMLELIGFNTPYSRVIDGREILIGRFIGLFGTSYFASSIYILCFAFSFAIWNDKKIILHFFLSLAMIISIVLTQSRTAFIAFLLFILVVTLTQLREAYIRHASGTVISKKALLKVFQILVFVTIPILLLVYSFGDNFNYLFQQLFGYYLPNIDSHLSSSSGSVGVRSMQFTGVVSLVNSSIIGIGLDASEFGSLESAYAYLLYTVGYAGLISYFGFLFFHWKFAWTSYINSDPHSSFQIFALSISSYILILPILSFSSIITDQIRLYAIFYFLFGAIASISEKPLRQGSAPSPR
jgi:hypothetical protein